MNTFFICLIFLVQLFINFIFLITIFSYIKQWTLFSFPYSSFLFFLHILLFLVSFISSFYILDYQNLDLNIIRYLPVLLVLILTLKFVNKNVWTNKVFCYIIDELLITIYFKLILIFSSNWLWKGNIINLFGKYKEIYTKIILENKINYQIIYQMILNLHSQLKIIKEK